MLSNRINRHIIKNMIKVGRFVSIDRSLFELTGTVSSLPVRLMENKYDIVRGFVNIDPAKLKDSSTSFKVITEDDVILLTVEGIEYELLDIGSENADYSFDRRQYHNEYYHKNRKKIRKYRNTRYHTLKHTKEII